MLLINSLKNSIILSAYTNWSIYYNKQEKKFILSFSRNYLKSVIQIIFVCSFSKWTYT